MFTRHKDTAPQRLREKLTSIWLLAKGDVPDDKLAVTWVDVAPGGRQTLRLITRRLTTVGNSKAGAYA